MVQDTPLLESAALGYEEHLPTLPSVSGASRFNTCGKGVGNAVARVVQARVWALLVLTSKVQPLILNRPVKYRERGRGGLFNMDTLRRGRKDL